MGRIIQQGLNLLPRGLNSITKAWIDKVISDSGSVTSQEARAVNAFTASGLVGFDRFYIHGLQNRIAAKISIVNPTTSSPITEVNSPTFSPGLGFNSDGLTSYLDYQYIPSIDGVEYRLTSASYYVYSRTNSLANVCDMGVVSGGVSEVNIRWGDSNFYTSVNAAPTYAAFLNSSSLGFFACVRDGANTVKGYRNGVLSVTDNSNAATALPSRTFYGLCRNSGGTPAFFSQRQISISAFGSGSIDQSQLYTAIQTLATSLGFNV